MHPHDYQTRRGASLASHPAAAPVDRLVREHERRQITSVPRMSWWRLERDGLAPRRIVLGPRTVAWSLVELQAWVAARVAERDAEAA